MTGIGGDAFCLFYEAKSKRVHALNGSGRSSAKASLDDICRDLDIQDRIYGAIPNNSILSVTVPGAAAAWLDIIENFGSGKVTASQALAPAVQLAEEGFPVSEISSYYVRLEAFFPTLKDDLAYLRMHQLVGQDGRGATGQAQRDRLAQRVLVGTRRVQGPTSRRASEEPSPGSNVQTLSGSR